MIATDVPEDEEVRLRTLYSYEVLDTVEEQAFDDLCEIAAAICDTPISLVTLVDRRRQWFKAHVGWSTRETEREWSFCAHAIREGDLMVVEDTTRDSRFADNQLVVTSPHVRFYAGAPLRAYNGHRLGTLCAIDRRPRQLDPWQRSALQALARQVEAQLELRRVQQDKDLLGRFVIHDMRSPLTSMLINIGHAVKEAEERDAPAEGLRDLEKATELLQRRVQDFHGLLASEGAALQPRIEDVDVRALVEQLQASLALPLAEHGLRLESSLQQRIVRADPELLERILENLVYNASEFGPHGSAIRIETWADEDRFTLRVTDEGPGVPEPDRETIFDPYQRGSLSTPRGSTGLGLAFCRRAAAAMGGRITCEEPETGSGAVFRLTVPG